MQDEIEVHSPDGKGGSFGKLSKIEGFPIQILFPFGSHEKGVSVEPNRSGHDLNLAPIKTLT